MFISIHLYRQLRPKWGTNLFYQGSFLTVWRHCLPYSSLHTKDIHLIHSIKITFIQTHTEAVVIRANLDIQLVFMQIQQKYIIPFGSPSPQPFENQWAVSKVKVKLVYVWVIWYHTLPSNTYSILFYFILSNIWSFLENFICAQAFVLSTEAKSQIIFCWTEKKNGLSRWNRWWNGLHFN